MTSRPETPTQTTGAHRAHRDGRGRPAPRTVPQRPTSRYEPYLDGLFTYCLSVLCDHDDALAALGDALALAERRGSRGPESESDRKAWLYALARWSCLRALAEARRRRQGTHASGRPHPETPPAKETPSEEIQAQRRRELALLAWPEAAGTTPEQREALELAVRHQLSPREVAAALGTDPALTRELLASAACEVERTRAALAVVETGTCPSVARLTGDNQLLLSSALRRELVRHVDDCPRCRRTAERATPGAWPGTTVTPAALPLATAPRAALHRAMAHGNRSQRGAAPRFDRRGFPMDPKDRAARRDRLRARAVTTTVVATVVAAPVLGLWGA
jgi:DNA-directed RNA polymerase specialized sigma24 family protein